MSTMIKTGLQEPIRLHQTPKMTVQGRPKRWIKCTSAKRLRARVTRGSELQAAAGADCGAVRCAALGPAERAPGVLPAPAAAFHKHTCLTSYQPVSKVRVNIWL